MKRPTDLSEALHPQIAVLVDIREISLENAFILARIQIDKQPQYVEVAKTLNAKTLKKKIIEEDLNPAFICTTEGCKGEADSGDSNVLCKNCFRVKQGLREFLNTTGGMKQLKALLYTVYGLKVVDK